MKLVGFLLIAACSAQSADRLERFALILDDKPLAADVSSRKELARSSRRDQVSARQNVATTALQDRGIRVLAAEQTLVNAIFVEAPADAADTLQSIPGVALVERLRPMKRHLNEAVNLMNVPAAWSAVNGAQNAGAGVKIAILDTGIDQNHPAFQDSSLQFPAGFPRGVAGWTNSKVIVARSYVDMLVGGDPATSRPDDLSPRDRVGHGTAVAMIAAGVRNTGPTATITGVASRAWLGNYKVYGSPGVNGKFTYADVVIRALTEAIGDGMDIAVVSLGAPAVWGPGDRPPTCRDNSGKPCDWRADAVENAARLGLTIVVSAGDDGDLSSVYPAFNSIQTPGTAPSAITVGASTNSHILNQSLRIAGASLPADLTRLNTLIGDGPPAPEAGLTAPIRDASAVGDALTCLPLPAGSLSGAIALVRRGTCSFVTKINNAQQAGAVGVIIFQLENVNSLFTMTGLAGTGIPAVLIGSRDGVSLKAYVGRQSGVAATIDPSLNVRSTTESDIMAGFSSRGPAIRTNAIKPELVAVGTDLYTATQRYDPNGDLYNSSGYALVNGTSFAAPLVAGAAAIVKQRYPNMTPAQLKSAVVNTANPRVTDFDNGRIINAGVLDMGAGRLDAGAAAQTNITVEPATVSFGVWAGQTPGPSTLRFCNVSGGNLNLRLTVVPVPGLPNSPVPVLSSTSITVNANNCSEGTTLRLSGSRPVPGVYEGAIQITGGAVPLRVPYLYLIGNGTAFSILPLEGNGFERATGSTIPLTFKVTDRFGLPVQGLNVAFQTTVGGGSIRQEGKTTDELGIGFADVIAGSNAGEQEYFAQIGPERSFGIFFGGRALVRPDISLSGVVDAASQQGGRGFAPGSYITIYGTALTQPTRTFNTPYLPLSLSNVSVSFDVRSRNLSLPGRIAFLSSTQINVQVPWELQGADSAQIKVSYGDFSSSLISIPIANQSPSLFEYPIQTRRSDVISLYANGLGPVDNQPASGEPSPSGPLATTRTAPTVTVGGRSAEVLFSGLAPGFVGLYQINLRIPADAPSGAQPVVISAGGVSSKPANIQIE
ncbi:MAG: S8 family serine peptidase [Bryobacteraceae bacterium]|nr:S8 family serine peptidase [Bryobacteraceae bacterium]